MAHLPAILVSLLSLSAWLAILTAIFAPLEFFFAVRRHKTFREGLGVDLCYYFLNGLFPSIVLGALGAILGWSVQQLVPGTLLEFTASLPLWARLVLGLVVSEVGYYWGHRLSHQIPFLWRFHSIHHSAEELDFLVNMRAHPLDLVFGRICALVPMYVLGLGGPTGASGGTALPVFIMLFGTMWGFFIHANLKWNLGPFEWLISTPKFHHWHHTKNGLIDHNYSSTLPWLDRLFGTHNLPKEWPEAYGINAAMPPSLVDQLVYPLLPKDASAAVNSSPSDNQTS